MCTELVGTSYSIEIMRSDDERGAFHDGVTETPCILVNEPGERRRRLGGFAEAEKFMQQLRLRPAAAVGGSSGSGAPALLSEVRS